MHLSHYQDEVQAWVEGHGGFFSPLSNLARLTEEVGELARALAHRHGDKVPKPGESEGEIDQELGDIVFVCAVLAAQLEISLEGAAQASLAKARRRDENRFSGQG